MIHESTLIDLQDQKSVPIKDLKPGDILKHGFIVKEIIKEKLSSPRVGIRLTPEIIVDQDHFVMWNILKKTIPEFVRANQYQFCYLTFMEKDSFLYDLVLENSAWFEIDCWCFKSFNHKLSKL